MVYYYSYSKSIHPMAMKFLVHIDITAESNILPARSKIFTSF